MLGRRQPVCGNPACGHPTVNHILRHGRRRGCVHATADHVCQCQDFVESGRTEPVVYELTPPPPHDPSVRLTDRHGDVWAPYGEAEWRRQRDGFVTTWANLLGVHGPITHDPNTAAVSSDAR